MKILLTGATGYIAKRLLPVLLSKGHSVVCCVRDAKRFDVKQFKSSKLEVIEVNFLDKSTLKNIPKGIDAAYYLIHSMSSSINDFEKLEKTSALNFRERIEETNVKQVIYLSGIVNNKKLSKHLLSRKQVEEILSDANYSLTTLRAGIIVGSGSASFEIIRDLVEKLPIMIAPRWLNTQSQPIAIQDVIAFLSGVLMNKQAFSKSFDIGGPEVITYKQMLLKYAKVRNLKRKIFVIPLMTPKISSYWLYFVTSTSYKLAVNLVNSMKVEVVCEDNQLQEILDISPITYEEAVLNAFDKIEQQDIVSSWTDALSSKILEDGISNLINVPTFGCFKDIRTRRISNEGKVLNRIWGI